MPNLAGVLKDEIRRLARKEIRAELATTRKASTQHRRDIAALKRQVQDQQRQIAGLKRERARGGGAAAAAQDAATAVRFSPKWVLNHRESLGLSAADYAALIGVSAQTVYNWESGKSRPQAQQLAAWGAVRKLGKREAWRRLDEDE